MVDIGVGIAKNTYPVDDASGGYPGHTADSVAGFGSGYMGWSDTSGGTSLSRSTASSGSLICTAIDFDNGRFYQRVGATGAWNAGASDPVTGAGALTFTVASVVPAFPLLWFQSANGTSSQVATENFGGSAFSGAIPAGYTSWDGSQSGSIANLIANAVVTGSPAIQSPTIGQTHALSATNVSAPSPVITSPTLGQTHALAANSIATGAPALGSVTLGQTHVLAATAVIPASPSIGSPTFQQIHVLTSPDLVTSAPVLGTPGLTQTHVLTAINVVVSSPAADSADVAASTDICRERRCRASACAGQSDDWPDPYPKCCKSSYRTAAGQHSRIRANSRPDCQ
jgi:hypothetical protein